ncbi:helix-turn-helix transcriptional regulator [Shewanella olleyana]|uniref:helix-turn-helix domain-containing protein n=1 Tax=Shewanella olleyana TaxID=135626 RepID=UPI00200DBED8|nr:AraC family transcriptional regulator [Shewanella olleyana]MCL1066045.1 helix-turn-helix transcriptional regulator [Shewanella olleyana]
MSNNLFIPTTSMSIHKGWMKLINQTADRYALPKDKYFNEFTNVNAQLDVRDIRTILYQMTQDSGDPFYPFQASEQVNPLTFGCYSLTLWTAPTLLQLLKDACKYCVAIGSPIRLRFHETPQGNIELWVVNHEPLNKESHVTYAGVTLYMSTILQIIHQTTEFRLDDIGLKLIQWPYEARLQAEFEQKMQCNISVGSPIRKICIRRQHLFTPLATSDAAVYPLAQKLLRQHATKIEVNDIVLQVYKVLDSMTSLTDISCYVIAQKMLFSTRTLNRRLQEVGTSYRGVVEKYKLEKALQLLNQPNTNMTEIAFQLGFSDLSTFSRAFKRWTGSSPSHLDSLAEIKPIV